MTPLRVMKARAATAMLVTAALLAVVVAFASCDPDEPDTGAAAPSIPPDPGRVVEVPEWGVRFLVDEECSLEDGPFDQRDGVEGMIFGNDAGDGVYIMTVVFRIPKGVSQGAAAELQALGDVDGVVRSQFASFLGDAIRLEAARAPRRFKTAAGETAVGAEYAARFTEDPGAAAPGQTMYLEVVFVHLEDAVYQVCLGYSPASEFEAHRESLEQTIETLDLLNGP